MNEPVWQQATIVKKQQTAEDIISLFAKPKLWTKHRAGQHYQIRLVGQNLGRDYSIVSSPINEEILEFGVQLIPTGVISPRLWKIPVGEEIEIRGPLGENFVWEENMSDPIVLIGAGSGITPLLAIYAHYRSMIPQGKVTFIMSAKVPEKIMYYDQLKDQLITRFTSIEGRIDREFLRLAIDSNRSSDAKFYVCGPIEFIDDMVDYLLDMGIDEDTIRAERFI